MSGSEKQSLDQLEFVTLDGLLAYGDTLAQRVSSGRALLPPPPPRSTEYWHVRRPHSAASTPSSSGRNPACRVPKPIVPRGRTC